MKILYGLTLNTAQKLKEPLETALNNAGREIQTVCRYRKEGIYQYAKEQKDILIILEENLQGNNPYDQEDIQQLTDISGNRIIFLVNRSHYGSNYLKILYACGVYDALFLDEVTPAAILDLINHERNNEEARKYYGISISRDMEKIQQIINLNYLNDYLEFLEEACLPQDINYRYRFVASRLGEEENRILAASLPDASIRVLQGNEIYHFYAESGKKRRIFPLKMRIEKENTYTKNVEKIENMWENDTEDTETEIDRNDDIIQLEHLEKEEDMLKIMEQYRAFCQQNSDMTFVSYGVNEDMRIKMGRYLREIDI